MAWKVYVSIFNIFRFVQTKTNQTPTQQKNEKNSNPRTNLDLLIKLNQHKQNQKLKIIEIIN